MLAVGAQEWPLNSKGLSIATSTTDVARCGDNFLYGFKGARSAPGSQRASQSWQAPRDRSADRDAAQLPSSTGGASGGTFRHGRRLPP
jgi:hypothetical protein